MIKSSASLKDKVSNLAHINNIPNQYLIQTFMFESLLKRISISPYKEKFVIKGGFLLASLFGVNLRATMDLDATVVGLSLSLENISNVFKEIIKIDLDDNIKMEIVHIKDIRLENMYPGFRVNILACFDNLKTNLIVDITTGDLITYKEVEYNYHTVLDNELINILTYNYETIIAEKFESIISRNVTNSRMKDYYDLYMFTKLKWDEVNNSVLRQAIINTSRKRETEGYMTIVDLYIDLIENDDSLKKLWLKYQKDYIYASNISFEEVIKSLKKISDILKRRD